MRHDGSTCCICSRCTTQRSSDARHRAFVIALERALEDGEPGYDEYNNDRPCDRAWRRVQRAARRFLLVMEVRDAEK